MLAKSIERIHKANLINFAIVPIEFDNPDDYDRVNADDTLRIPELLESIRLLDTVRIINDAGGYEFKGRLTLSTRDRDILLAGGLLNLAKKATR